MTDAPTPADEPTKPTPETENPESEKSSAPETAPAPAQISRYLWITIVALAALLLISIVMRPPAAGTADDAKLAALQADLEARREAVNRELVELNLPTLAARGEAIQDITARMRKDADTLISLVERSQQLVAEKDRQLTEKNVALIRSEQLREALSSEIGRAQISNIDANRLRDELSESIARANRLAEDLAEARQRIAELSEAPPTDELDVMQRRLDEVTRARDFFEQRAEELEQRLRKLLDTGLPDGDAPPTEEFPEEP